MEEVEEVEETAAVEAEVEVRVPTGEDALMKEPAPETITSGGNTTGDGL